MQNSFTPPSSDKPGDWLSAVHGACVEIRGKNDWEIMKEGERKEELRLIEGVIEAVGLAVKQARVALPTIAGKVAFANELVRVVSAFNPRINALNIGICFEVPERSDGYIVSWTGTFAWHGFGGGSL